MISRKFHPREIIDQAVDKYDKWITKEIEDLLEHEKKKLLTKIEEIIGKKHEIDPIIFRSH
jgi:hypothetical protein